ncbi:MAG: DUF2332 family protein, partial [Acidimicrobiales bacterium]
VVVTTAAAGYLSGEQRTAFADVLAAASSAGPPVAWLSSEGAGIVDAFADHRPPDDDPDRDVVGAVVLRRDSRRHHFLGFAHKHGRWVDWRASPAGTAR